jgi:hypothetical protein
LVLLHRLAAPNLDKILTGHTDNRRPVYEVEPVSIKVS